MSDSVGGHINKENGKTICTLGAFLPEIIPMAELERVFVGDIEYTLPKINKPLLIWAAA